MTSKLFVLVFSVLFACYQVFEQVKADEAEKTFLYFAYGSNMLSERIHKNNPSAKPVAIAKLKNHRLDFLSYSKTWHGSVSTIVPTKNSKVWGVAWEISVADMPKLDKQEGVKNGKYFVKNVTVQTADGTHLKCRTYQQTLSPKKYASPNKLPKNRRPSPAYLNTIIEGAREHNITSDYVEFLQSFRHNNYQGEVKYH